jgi:1,4-alpha-glucan branching enzyme
MRIFCLISFLFVSSLTFGQTVTLSPTITPALFRDTTSITVVYDVTGTALANLTAAYAWVWIPGATVLNATSNVTPANASPANVTATANAKFTMSVVNSKTLFTLTFKPANFFTQDISSATQMGILLKGNDWPNGQTTDYLADFWDGSFQIKLTSPTTQPLFVSDGDTILVQASSSVAATYTLLLNNVSIDVEPNLSNYSYILIVNDSVPSYTVSLTATANSKSSSASFSYIIPHPSPSVPRPAGIIDGINYSADQTKVTVSIWAPQKTSVYILGDFNNWAVNPAYEANRDGEHFWLEIDGLTPGVEYGFQYLVDQTLFVADPYADKILDHANDPYIPTNTYPNLKPYPSAAVHSQDYFNRVSVFQTGQTPYTWQATNYVKPVKEKLVIYELLIRDFFTSPNQNYQSLIDTIGYFKRLGVNAIELMPVTEFNGNDSWGYNPTFMFAPDKYYGTKNKMKEFIDTCHKNGIAVIMDLVMNQQDLPNPYVLMYYDFSTSLPLATSPWFNVVAPHPYSVFYDLNHESTYTQKYLDTINYHWLHDYKVDGLRFDLAKGFTQFYSGNNVTLWGNYDASRINLLERMSNVIWSYQPDAYVILEHFADNSEETVLANYQADQNKGMMLWENYNYAFNQNTMGYSDGSDFSAIWYVSKGWSKPHEVSYMESHDEERLMYNNLNYGNISGSYNVKTLSTALERMKAASLLFYSVPGPKMLWEFGELGYDKSINTCNDGVTISTDCRTYDKPVLWSYASVPARKDLLNQTADLIRLNKSFSLFSQGVATIATGTSLVKQIQLNNQPYTATPTDSTQMNAQIVANMDVTAQSAIVTFAHTGTWYDYYNKSTAFQVSSTSQVVALNPGDYKLYTDVKITNPIVAVVTGLPEKDDLEVKLYPNPAADLIFAEVDNTPVSSLSICTLQGVRISPMRVSENSWDVRDLSPGFYIAEIQTSDRAYKVKVIKK